MSKVSILTLLLCGLLTATAPAASLQQESSELRQLAATGQFKRANDLAAETVKKYGDRADPVELARFDLLHARLLLFTRYGEGASDAIERAEKVLDTHDDASLKADLAATRAKLLVNQRDRAGASAQYRIAADAYKSLNLPDEEARVVAEWVSIAPKDAEQRARDLLKADLSASQDTTLRVAIARGLDDSASPADALGQWRTIADRAEQLDDARTAAGAWARVASIYEANRQPADALIAARKGLFHAQKAGADDLKFQFDWQIGRLQKAQQQSDSAIDSYFRSVRSLQGVRHDLLIHMARSGATGTFRQNIGPVYYQLADLLIQRSAAKPDQEQQEDLKLARQVIEQLKTVELEDYFQDQCVNLAKEQEQIVDRDLQSAAVVYVIPLAERTEILISTPGGRIERVTSPATDSQISQTARQFRYDATNREDASYRRSGKQLYDWVIAPILPVLENAGQPIDTLVFVPDGDLRMVPMAALWDGRQFLTQRYAIAVSPGLTLMRPEPLDRAGRQLSVLKAGVTIERTVGKQTFSALPNVSNELDEIQKLYPGALLKDETFVNSSFEQQLEQDTFRIVHIASHGQFKAEARDTFILTYDSTLNLDQLERLMMPSRFKDDPIELLTLSACQTAAGDDGARAALGMAGIAVKAGARSAMATLWFVSDEASSALVSKFYEELQRDPTLSRSKALRNAQLSVLDFDRFRHPYYWAPFLMIGNWK